MLADRLMAELRVEGGHPRYLRRRDLGDLAHTPQGLLGQVAVVTLDLLKNRNDRLGFSSHLLNEPVNRR